MNGTTESFSLVCRHCADRWSIVGQRDFNGDGKADFLWRDTTGDVAIWLMNGTTDPLSAWYVGTVPTSLVDRGTGDFNGDGKYATFSGATLAATWRSGR